MAIQTQGDKARLLQAGVYAVATSMYKDKPLQTEKIFGAPKPSDKAYEIVVSVSELSLASVKPEGTEITYDKAKQDFTTSFVHKVYGLGTQITMEAQMNNKYEDLVNKAGKMLAKSLRHTDEQLAADIINNGYTDNLIGGTKPLFSTTHILGKGGTFSNRFTVFTSLSRTAIEDALIDIDDYRDGANLLIDARGVSLHIPRQLRFVAQRLMKSDKEPGSANNDINTVMNIFPGGVHVNNRFTDSTDWFIKTDQEENGFMMFERMGYTYSQDNDFGTENFRSKGLFYKSYGAVDPRCCFGSGT